MTDTVLKGLCPFKTKDSQPAARIICSLKANKFHTCSLRCIFCQVQKVNCPEGTREATLGCAPAENDFILFVAMAANSARLLKHCYNYCFLVA